MTVYFFIWHPLHVIFIHCKVENRESNSRLVVDENGYGKFGFERVKTSIYLVVIQLNELFTYSTFCTVLYGLIKYFDIHFVFWADLYNC